MNMPRITIFYSVFLISLGLFAYFIWGDQQSWTALIPSFAGVLFFILAFLAAKTTMRKHIMHLVVILSFVLMLGTVKAIPSLFTLLQGGEVARPLAVKVQALTAVASLVFILLCVKTFIDARRAGKI